MRYSLRDYSITAQAKGWGRGWPTNRGGDMRVVTFARSKVRVSVHKDIADLVRLLGDETERRGYLAKSGQTGAFNSRPISGTSRPSNHSWGLAIDWNWRDNAARYDGVVGGTFPRAIIREVWNRFGFAWGGDYTGSFKDAMHLEFMGGPMDAHEMTDAARNSLRHPPATAPTTGEWDEMATKAEVAAVVREVVQEELKRAALTGTLGEKLNGTGLRLLDVQKVVEATAVQAGVDVDRAKGA